MIASTTSAFGLIGSTATSKYPPFASPPSHGSSSTKTTTSLFATTAVEGKKKQPYVPKWVKKQTLANSSGDTKSLGYKNVGLKGTIPVVFKQGNETRTSMAWDGQPIRDVASQAGQHIQYGCGKGQCGTCECMLNGKWIRPCVTAVSKADVPAGGKLILQLKAVKNRSKSSGRFFSLRSFIMGFWNNLLGMFGFLKFRKNAMQNWNERKAYEELIAQKTLEKKLRRKQQQAIALAEAGASSVSNNRPAPGMA